MVYTIGDSHSKFGWCEINGVKFEHLGPKLMYTFKKEDFNIKNITDNDYVVFCFGEIDVRCHIKKHVVDDYKDIITKMCVNYFNTILEIKLEYKIKNIYIYNILPTRRVDTVEPYNITCANYQKYDEEIAKPYPFVGTDLERKNYTIFFNLEMERLSKQHDLGFIDVYSYYSDEDGYFNMNLSDGTVHIGDKVYLENKIKNIFKI